MKGIYLCSRKHRIPGYDIDYNDIVKYEGITKPGDAREIDISNYDFIIATPPCNYYSRANWRRETSKIAQETKNILPICIDKCIKSKKPFIIENVLNSKLLPQSDLYIFTYGQHTFYTNVFLFVPDPNTAEKQNKQYKSRNQRDGNKNVDTIIKLFLERVKEIKENNL